LLEKRKLGAYVFRRQGLRLQRSRAGDYDRRHAVSKFHPKYPSRDLRGNHGMGVLSRGFRLLVWKREPKARRRCLKGVRSQVPEKRICGQYAPAPTR